MSLFLMDLCECQENQYVLDSTDEQTHDKSTEIHNLIIQK